jgi:hypothetical protein
VNFQITRNKNEKKMPDYKKQVPIEQYKKGNNPLVFASQGEVIRDTRYAIRDTRFAIREGVIRDT